MGGSEVGRPVRLVAVKAVTRFRCRTNVPLPRLKYILENAITECIHEGMLRPENDSVSVNIRVVFTEAEAASKE